MPHNGDVRNDREAAGIAPGPRRDVSWMARIAALAMVVGFFGATVASATLIPSFCCGTPCDHCPIVYCKDTAAVLSTKCEAAAVSLPAPNLISFAARFQPLAAPAALAWPALPPGFQRPSRN